MTPHHKTHVAVIGASGAIGSSWVNILAEDTQTRLFAFSRSGTHFNHKNVTNHPIDLTDETSIAEAATLIQTPLDCVLVTTGILHQEHIQPEKALRDVSAEKFEAVFSHNTIGPMLVAKHFLPKLNRSKRTVFAALSARVGSINDNRLGGWYAYRASKAALNMLIKTASIEMQRTHPASIVVGLHPGTVDSTLSKPFQQSVPDGKLFTPNYSASQLNNVINSLSSDDTGKLFAWDGKEIPF